MLTNFTCSVGFLIQLYISLSTISQFTEVHVNIRRILVRMVLLCIITLNHKTLNHKRQSRRFFLICCDAAPFLSYLKILHLFINNFIANFQLSMSVKEL